MPTPNEIPGVSLIDRLQAENKKLKDENAELHKSISKLQLFNKILEREITELKQPPSPEPFAQNDYQKEPGAPLPIKKYATYAVIGLLVIASIYAVASLFSGSKSSSVPPAVSQTTDTVAGTNPASSASATRKTTVIPPTTLTASQRAMANRIDTSRRRRALMEDHTPYDSIGASDFSLGHFKVQSRAYFHTKPDTSTRSTLYINPLTRTPLEALDEKNGFVFVVFKNELGKVTRGWLRKTDLREVSAR